MISIRALIVSGLFIALLLMGGTLYLTLQNSAYLSRDIKSGVTELSDTNSAVAEICALILNQFLIARDDVSGPRPADRDEFIRLSTLVNQRLNLLASSMIRPEERRIFNVIRQRYTDFEREAFRLLGHFESGLKDPSIIERIDMLLRQFTDEMLNLSDLVMIRSRANTAQLADDLSADNALISGIVFITLFAFLFFLLVINNAILRPATRLIEATRRVTAGDLRFSLDFRAGSEIGSLVKSFNQMVTTLAANQDEIMGKTRQLQALNEEMAGFNADLERKIEDRSARLRESQEYLRRIIYGSPVSIAMFTPDGLLEDCNDAFLRIAGARSRQQCIGSARLGSEGFFEQADIVAGFSQALAGMPARVGPVRYDVSGRQYWFVHHIVPLHDLGGSVSKVLCHSMDVTQEHAAREEALTKNAELESFVYTVSHDLKSPLFSIAGMLRLLTPGSGDGSLDVTQEELIRRIESNVQAMEQMISDLLELSRAGANREKFAAFDPRELVRLVYLEEKVQRGVRDIDFHADEFQPVFADQRLVGQLFRNLINNAIKYRNPSRVLRLEVRSAREGDMVRYEIEDNGLGIAPEIQEKVFDVFYRVAPLEVEGSGVGLAIVKKIVESHGGRISLRSTRGEGTIFSFTLPAAVS